MKILFYNHTNQVSGAERVLLLILARLSRARFEPVLLSPAEGQLQKHAKALGVRCKMVNRLEARFTWRADRLLSYLASFVFVIRQVRARVIEVEPDLIHANSIRSGLVISAATIGLGIPIIWHVHDLLPKHPFSALIRTFVLLFPPVRIVAVSRIAGDRLRGNLLRAFPARVRVTVIHNSVDVGNPRTGQNQNAAIRKELRLRSADRLIGIVGNLSPIKGQLELITAFANVLAKVPDAWLLIVGSALFNRDEGYSQQLLEQAKALGIAHRIRFMGQRDDVPAIMSSLDLLVLNSKSEACPLVALEGLACGVPVLSTTVGGVPELITHGKHGWLIPAGDQDKLTEAIVSVIEQPELRARLVTNGRRRVEARFTVNEFMTRLETIYMETSARPHSPAAGAELEIRSPTNFSFSRIERTEATTN